MLIQEKIRLQIFNPELRFQMSRSSGPGGQNVNKVNSKVSLTFDIKASEQLTNDEKAKLMDKLKKRIDSDGILHIQVQEKRSQYQNKELAVKKFYELLAQSFKKKKLRLASKPSVSAVQERLKNKKMHAQKKANRKKDFE
jgi:ribosome-associated protein